MLEAALVHLQREELLLSLTETFFDHFQVGKMKKSKSFFHALKATLDRLADRLLMYALGLGNFLN